MYIQWDSRRKRSSIGNACRRGCRRSNKREKVHPEQCVVDGIKSECTVVLLKGRIAPCIAEEIPEYAIMENAECCATEVFPSPHGSQESPIRGSISEWSG